MSASNESYRQYKLVKELRQNKENNFVNDYSEVGDYENSYCDSCDRQLKQFDIDRLYCQYCQIIVDTKFSIVRRKASKQGPVDGDITDDGNDISIVSEHYRFGGEKEKEDVFISSLKHRGYQIVSSSKQ